MAAKATPASQNIGSRIKEVRERQGLSQEDVARELRYSRVAVHQVEQGQRRITLDLLLRYAVALQTTVGDLLHGTGVSEGDLQEPCPACLGSGRVAVTL